MKDRYYGCVDGDKSCVGDVLSVEEWKEVAIEWAEEEERYDIAYMLSDIPTNKVMSFISDFWQLSFEEVW